MEITKHCSVTSAHINTSIKNTQNTISQKHRTQVSKYIQTHIQTLMQTQAQ